MTISRLRPVAVMLGICAAPLALAAEQSNSVIIGSAERAPLVTNGVAFSTQGDPHWQDMQRRLADPRERAKMRAESRARQPGQFPDLTEVVRIDQALADKLFDLMADQEIANQEEMFNRNPGDPFRPMSDYSDRANTTKDKIRALLGDAAFDRYIQYDATRMERVQIAQFDQGLGAPDKLSLSQKDKMIVLVQDRMSRMVLAARNGMVWRRMDMQKMMRQSPQDRELENLKVNIAANEESVRAMRVEKTEMLGQARSFMTPVQLAAYGKFYDGRIEQLRSRVQDMRVRAGMSPDFDDQSPPQQYQEPERYLGKVRMHLLVTLDEGEAQEIELVTDNGKAPPAFSIGPMLWAEAVPVLYADRGGSVSLKYFEERGGKRIPVRGGSVVNTVPESVARFAGGGMMGMQIDGSKMHSVQLEAQLSPAQ
jgi:hypothetical protein